MRIRYGAIAVVGQGLSLAPAQSSALKYLVSCVLMRANDCDLMRVI
jgi:hypothetical protein